MNIEPLANYVPTFRSRRGDEAGSFCGRNRLPLPPQRSGLPTIPTSHNRLQTPTSQLQTHTNLYKPLQTHTNQSAFMKTHVTLSEPRPINTPLQQGAVPPAMDPKPFSTLSPEPTRQSTPLPSRLTAANPADTALVVGPVPS